MSVTLLALVATWGGEASSDQAPSASPAPPSPAPPSPPPPSLSPKLRAAALHSPLPGGLLGGWAGDTGLDVSASFRPVHAIAAGTLDYSEPGHTRWTGGKDTPNSVRIKLDAPIAWKEHRITHVYYTHLSRLETLQHEGDDAKKHVEAGEKIGTSGIGNGVPHLHIGLLLDDRVEQDTWDSLLVEGDVRKIFGGYRNGERI